MWLLRSQVENENRWKLPTNERGVHHPSKRTKDGGISDAEARHRIHLLLPAHPPAYIRKHSSPARRRRHFRHLYWRKKWIFPPFLDGSLRNLVLSAFSSSPRLPPVACFFFCTSSCTQLRILTNDAIAHNTRVRAPRILKGRGKRRTLRF